MKPTNKTSLITIIAILIPVFGISILFVPGYLLLPMFLKSCDRDAISLLSVYKTTSMMFYLSFILYSIIVIISTILFTLKIATKKLLGPKMLIRCYIVIIMFTSFGILFVSDNQDALDTYAMASADLKEYESGNVNYTEEMIYLENIYDDFDTASLTQIFDVDYETEALLERIQTFDPAIVIERENSFMPQDTKDLFSYYKLPENVDFDESEVQKVEYYDRDTQSLDYFYDSFKPLYESNVYYKIGYTTNYKLIYSIEKIVK